MAQRIDLRDALRVRPRYARPPRAAATTARPSAGTRKRPRSELETQLDRLADLQDRLWAEAKRSVLVVLQGIDAAGKDGTINKVMEAFNPQGCPVTSFKVPSSEELAHDYLWRVHQEVPRKGEIGIFNRSHYEDVLVVRVHDIVPRKVWSARYDQINDFERHLTRQRHDDRQVLPVDRQGRAARTVPGTLRRSDQALEVLDGRPRGAQALGRLPGRVRRRPVEDVDRRGARGTSSRPTASGSATSPWPRSSPTRWPGCDPSTRRSPTTSRPTSSSTERRASAVCRLVGGCTARPSRSGQSDGSCEDIARVLR